MFQPSMEDIIVARGEINGASVRLLADFNVGFNLSQIHSSLDIQISHLIFSPPKDTTHYPLVTASWSAKFIQLAPDGLCESQSNSSTPDLENHICIELALSTGVSTYWEIIGPPQASAIQREFSRMLLFLSSVDLYHPSKRQHIYL